MTVYRAYADNAVLVFKETVKKTYFIVTNNVPIYTIQSQSHDEFHATHKPVSYCPVRFAYKALTSQIIPVSIRAEAVLREIVENQSAVVVFDDKEQPIGRFPDVKTAEEKYPHAHVRISTLSESELPHYAHIPVVIPPGKKLVESEPITRTRLSLSLYNTLKEMLIQGAHIDPDQVAKEQGKAASSVRKEIILLRKELPIQNKLDKESNKRIYYIDNK